MSPRSAPWVVFAAIGTTIVVVILFVTAKTGQPGFDRDGGN
jgi:Na+/melibiose symporter-like transporter